VPDEDFFRFRVVFGRSRSYYCALFSCRNGQGRIVEPADMHRHSRPCFTTETRRLPWARQWPIHRGKIVAVGDDP